MINRLTGRFKPPIKLFWWRLENSRHGNFGDEITREIITKIFHRTVVWEHSDLCDMIGVGSLIEHVLEGKRSNRPFLWTSGFIQKGDLTISDNDYKIVAVRGKLSLSRVTGPKDDIVLGDAGLLANYLLSKRPPKRHRLGILPHYADRDHAFVRQLEDKGLAHVISATWPCQKVVEEIAKCEAILSSSLHGLIVADSLGVPNMHVKLSDNLKGGLYKFKDYYSIYHDDERYQVATLSELKGRQHPESLVQEKFKPIEAGEISAIKEKLLASFPMR